MKAMPPGALQFCVKSSQIIGIEQRRKFVSYSSFAMASLVRLGVLHTCSRGQVWFEFPAIPVKKTISMKWQ